MKRTLCEQLNDLDKEVRAMKTKIEITKELPHYPTKTLKENMEKYTGMLSDYGEMINSVNTYYKLKLEDYKIK